MTEPIAITYEEMDWFEDTISVYSEATKDGPESEVVAYLLKRAVENATQNKKGYVLHPVTQTERTTVLDVLDEWRELEAESD